MNWDYANRYGELNLKDSMIVEALVKIAEQLEQLNNNLIELKNSEASVRVSGGINTHPY